MLAQSYPAVQAVVAINGYYWPSVAALEATHSPHVKIVQTGRKQSPALTRLAAAQAADYGIFALASQVAISPGPP